MLNVCKNCSNTQILVMKLKKQQIKRNLSEINIYLDKIFFKEVVSFPSSTVEVLLVHINKL